MDHVVGAQLHLHRDRQATDALTNLLRLGVRGSSRAAPLEEALGHLQSSTMWLAQNGLADPNNAGAGAYAYMQLMGLVSLGWMWLKMAAASTRAIAPIRVARNSVAAVVRCRSPQITVTWCRPSRRMRRGSGIGSSAA